VGRLFPWKGVLGRWRETWSRGEVLFHADVFEYTDTLGDPRSYTSLLGIFTP
jgi:hypothetical protein